MRKTAISWYFNGLGNTNFKLKLSGTRSSLMILMILMTLFLIGLILPMQPTAPRLTSAMACAALPILSFPISVQAFVDGLKRSTCRWKQGIASSDKEFHTIPHLWHYHHLRSYPSHPVHQSPRVVGSTEQLWDPTAPWEKFTLPWPTLLKGSHIKMLLHRNYPNEFDNDCITNRWWFQQISQMWSWSL